MTNLTCNVSTCTHNASNLCCKEGIQVEGQKAFTSSATCCDSFEERSGAFTNSYQNPHSSLDISCDANNCTYNSVGKCAAEAIQIAGAMADCTSETQCSSFVPKQ